MAQFQGNLEKLNQFLADKSYCEGYAPSQQDTAAYATVPNNFDANKYPHVARWQSHIGSFSAAQRAKFPGKAPAAAPVEEVKKDTPAPAAAAAAPKAAAPAPAPAKAPAADSDSDELNLESDDDEDTKKLMAEKAAATKAVQDRQAAKAAQGSAKSDIAFDIKPAEASEDKEANRAAMEDLNKKIRAVEMDGLKWMGYQIIEVGYGIMKLRIMCQIIDIKVPGGPDEVKEAIEAQSWAEETIQSIDVFSFQMAA
jgi:elongation factor 1-beta